MVEAKGFEFLVTNNNFNKLGSKKCSYGLRMTPPNIYNSTFPSILNSSPNFFLSQMRFLVKVLRVLLESELNEFWPAAASLLPLPYPLSLPPPDTLLSRHLDFHRPQVEQKYGGPAYGYKERRPQILSKLQENRGNEGSFGRIFPNRGSGHSS